MSDHTNVKRSLSTRCAVSVHDLFPSHGERTAFKGVSRRVIVKGEVQSGVVEMRLLTRALSIDYERATVLHYNLREKCNNI